MDIKFFHFEKWYKSNIEKWEKQGIVISDVNYSYGRYGHHLIISLETKDNVYFSAGDIGLYESNGFYWVDFNAVKNGGSFDKVNVEFANMIDIQKNADEMIEFMLSVLDL